ncbi:MAG: phage/plasmid primase, P4 family [Aeromonadaceae bacterium]
MPNNIDAAQLWRGRGFRVLPILAGTKKPAVKWSAFIEGQTDERVAEHWAKHPDHLVAIVTDGLFIIDCDTPLAESNYQSLIAPLGPAPFCTMRTARGTHYYYHLPPGLPRVTARGDKIDGYLDIKCGKSYVIAAAPDRTELAYSASPAPITHEQIQLTYMLDGEVWPFPERQLVERPTWDGDPYKLEELRMVLDHIEAETLGYSDYLTVCAGVHGDFEGAGEALEILEEWSSDPHETASKWDSFTVGKPGGVTFASVTAMAAARGADLSAIQHKVQAMRVFSQIEMPTAASLAPPPAPSSPPPAPCIEHMPLAKLPTQTIPGLSGDQVLDALEIIRTHFGPRMARIDGQPHWWTGRNWEVVEQQEMRRQIGITMVGGVKATQGRVKATAEVIVDHLQHIQLPLDDKRVYFQNGVLDPLTGQLAPHNILNGNMTTLSVDYAPGAASPIWQSWLLDIFASEPERIELLQEMIGWCLCRHTLGIEKAMIFLGPRRAGKGTVIRVLKALLGPSAPPFRFAALDNDKSLSMLRRTNVAIDSDAAEPQRQDAKQVAGLFRTITSNEEIQVKLLYTQTPWAGPLGTKLLLAANSIPHMGDDSGATAGRWTPLVFDKSFFGCEDPELFDRLATELPAIAAWAAEGLRRLAVRGRFVLPQSSIDATDRATSSGSPITGFIDDNLEFAAGHRATDSQLYNNYMMWASANGVDPLRKRYFIEAIADACQALGVRWGKSVLIDGKQCRGFYGVRLRGTATQASVIPIRA